MLMGKNEVVNSLRHTREWLENKESESKFKPGDKPETPVLDQGGSYRGKPDEKLTDNSDKDSDWTRLIDSQRWLLAMSSQIC